MKSKTMPPDLNMVQSHIVEVSQNTESHMVPLTEPITNFSSTPSNISLGSVSTQMPTPSAFTAGKKIICFLFCQPYHSLSKNEILPNIAYYHFRSANHVNFYFSGYTNNGEIGNLDYQFVCELDGEKWFFSPKAFNDLRIDTEMRTNWKYGGEVELIVTNAIMPGGDIDFSSCVLCNLDEMKRIGAIPSVPAFFEKIFQYSEDQNDENPAWEFSDEMGLNSSRSALKSFLLSLLPKGIGSDAERIGHFAIRDISKK